MKVIEIDRDRLVDLLVEECDQLTLSDTGERYCGRKIGNGHCRVPWYYQDECPRDCPRLLVQDTRCDEGKCRIIRKKLNRLKKKGE